MFLLVETHVASHRVDAPLFGLVDDVLLFYRFYLHGPTP
jgi:hypothetical protein